MRLIDADEFKKEIAAVAISRNLNVKLANMLCKIIDSQPTACDMDKTAEKIKEEAKE